MPAFMLFFEFVRVKELVSWYFVQERVFFTVLVATYIGEEFI